MAQELAFNLNSALKTEELPKEDLRLKSNRPLNSAEPVTHIDEALNQHDFLKFLRAELERKGIAGPHISSMNEFYRNGINQIVTQLFGNETNIRNKRDSTSEDKDISDIVIRIEYKKAEPTAPKTTMSSAAEPVELTPNMARLRGQSYTCDIYLTFTVHVKAIYKDKNKAPTIKEFHINKLRIGSIPCMVGTYLCPTSRNSKEALREMGEDHLFPGGSVILDGGNDWIIEVGENISTNALHSYKNDYNDEVARGVYISKPGDAFENSRQLIITVTNDGGIYTEITINKDIKWKFPFYILFRALGMTRDYDIINHIVQGLSVLDTVGEQLKLLLLKAMKVVDNDFKGIMHETSRDVILQHIANLKRPPEDKTEAQKNKNVLRYLGGNIASTLDNYLLTNIGTEEKHRFAKTRYLARLIRKLLLVYLGIVPQTDRDHPGERRMHPAGTNLAKVFKTDFNFAVHAQFISALIKAFDSAPFSAVDVDSAVRTAIKHDHLEQLMKKSITAASKVIEIRNTKITTRIQAQLAQLKNDLNIKNMLNLLSASGTASNSNERADEMRRVNPGVDGFIDPTQSPESGHTVGLKKQFAVNCHIMPAASSYALSDTIKADPDIILWADTTPEQITVENLVSVDVNGVCIGYCRNAAPFIKKYINKRRNQNDEADRIHYGTVIVWDPAIREIHFKVDVGRLCRPVIIVYNNIEEYIAARKKGDKNFKFRQWIRLTQKHVRDLMCKRINMWDLLREGIVEFVSPEESRILLFAENIDALRKHQNNVLMQYTHCDCNQAMLGVTSLSSPDGNHSNGTRVTYFACQRKQASSWYALNYHKRIDKNVMFQYYNHYPLVSTFSDNICYPSGQNVTVAFMIHTGQNMEDSLIINKSSVQCGMFDGTFFTYEKAQLEKGEEFGKIDQLRTRNMKRGANFEHVDSKGFIKVGTLVKKGYVLVVKTYKLPKPDDEYTREDRSNIFKKDGMTPRVVDVQPVRNGKNEALVKVKLADSRPIMTGDKLCVTEDHEVATTQGWIPIKDVTLQHKVACLRDGVMTYEHPIELHSYDHEGPIYQIESQMVSHSVTLNHKMYVKLRNHTEYSLVEAANLFGKRVQYQKNAIWSHPEVAEMILTDGVSTKKVAMNAWLDLLGMFISDGWVDKTHSSRVTFCATKQRKIEHLRSICSELGVELKSYGEKHCIVDRFIKTALEPLSVGATNKYLPDYAFNVSQNQSRILLDSLISGDGHIDKKGNNMYYTSSRRLADDVSRLSLHCGYSSYISTRQMTETITSNGKIIAATTEPLRVSVIKTKNNPMVNHGHTRKQNSQSEKIVQFSGQVYCLTTPTGTFYTRRNGKGSWTGNSSRTGNKGIVAQEYLRVDMPYNLKSVVVDLIVNSHSIPSRMAINQLRETVLAAYGNAIGAHVGATTFMSPDVEEIITKLRERHGIKYGGHQRMIDGKTNEPFDTLIFSGTNFYQRLQKFVIDEQYANMKGPSMPGTRQPLEGKTVDGGHKLGEMEKDVYCAHGAMYALWEKFYLDSDGAEIMVCRRCKTRPSVNERHGIYKCNNCGDHADIVRVQSSWVANLFFNELSAMNIGLKIDTEKVSFPIDASSLNK